jgi:hypothetical protein
MREGILALKSIVYITSLHLSVARERGAHAERYCAHHERDGNKCKKDSFIALIV